MDLPSEQQVRIRAVLHRMAWRRARQERLRPEVADVLARPDKDRSRHRRDELARHGG